MDTDVRPSHIDRQWPSNSTILTPGTMCRCLHASPAPCAMVRRSRMGFTGRKLTDADDGDRQRSTEIDILTAMLTDGLPAVAAACAEAVESHLTCPCCRDRRCLWPASLAPLPRRRQRTGPRRSCGIGR